MDKGAVPGPSVLVLLGGTNDIGMKLNSHVSLAYLLLTFRAARLRVDHLGKRSNGSEKHIPFVYTVSMTLPDMKGLTGSIPPDMEKERKRFNSALRLYAMACGPHVCSLWLCFSCLLSTSL